MDEDNIRSARLNKFIFNGEGHYVHNKGVGLWANLEQRWHVSANAGGRDPVGELEELIMT